ncbi:MAG TPA: ectonucleotide pyrophosphatase/phosphodiesterase [Gemmatimonadales bacterium]|nr:ectonucleotide pyrophosphatase/phosphodiesterase [Gemmatimonadales bacterium]
MISSSRAASLLLATLAAAAMSGCGSRSPTPEARPLVILVSIDGFGAEYFGRLRAPNLEALARSGVRARSLRPVFPVKTFPNHYTIATGLYPARHGIVSNNFVDPTTGVRFRISDTAAVLRGELWGGEPLWVTAERQGRRAASYFWPGSDVAIGGALPSIWKRYDGTVPNADRVDSVLAWLALPAGQRPDLITLYFSEVDSRAHDDGPWSPAAAAAVLHVDSMIGRLVGGIRRLGLEQTVNLIVVSDHGMIATSPDSVVVLDDYLDTALVTQFDLGPLIQLEPRGISADSVLRALRRAPHLRLFHRDSTPTHWRYRGNARVAAVVGIPDEGWLFTTRRWLHRARFGGEHGYDPASPAMGALFIASGPAFRRGVVVEPFTNIHVYELVCRVLGLRPAPNDGSLDSVVGMLR